MIERVNTLPLLSASSAVNAELSHSDIKVWKRFKRLTPEQRTAVEQMYRRHAISCRKLGIETDPRFLPESMEDIVSGRYLEMEG